LTLSPPELTLFDNDLTIVNGKVFLAWVRSASEAPEHRIEGRTVSADGALGVIKSFSRSPDYRADFIAHATDPDGNVVVTWAYSNAGVNPEEGDNVVGARTLSVDGVLGPIQTILSLAPSKWISELQVELDATGRALIIWAWHFGRHRFRVQGSVGP
jgi:hypothetical protein